MTIMPRTSLSIASLALSATMILQLTGEAFAAPSISSASGEFSHGERVTLNGTGLGNRPDFNDIDDTWKGHRYMNFRFTDFSAGTFPSQSSYNNNPRQSDGFYPQRSGAWWSSWSNEGLSVENGGPSRSGKYLKRRQLSGTSEIGGASVWMPGAADAYGDLLISASFMMSATGNRQQSGKAFRVWGDTSAGSIYITSGGGGYSLRGDGSVENCSGGFNGDGIEWGDGPHEFQLGNWDRVTLEFDKSSGLITAYINGEYQWANKWWCNFGLGGHTIDFPNMLDDQSRGYGNDGSYNYADIYIDFSQARVVLGDKSSYSSSSKRELQLPIQWSSTSIAFALNAGEFSNGQTVYLYVMDSNGSVNQQGFPIVIGGDGTAPNPPTNIRISP